MDELEASLSCIVSARTTQDYTERPSLNTHTHTEKERNIIDNFCHVSDTKKLAEYLISWKIYVFPWEDEI